MDFISSIAASSPLNAVAGRTPSREYSAPPPPTVRDLRRGESEIQYFSRSGTLKNGALDDTSNGPSVALVGGARFSLGEEASAAVGDSCEALPDTG